MAWIEVHQELQNHPKVLMLRKLTGLPDDTVLGRVLKLWLWGLAYAPDGDLRKYESGMIEEACGISIDVLIRTGLVDKRPYLRLHDWWDYAGRFLKIKYKNSEHNWIRIEKSYTTKSRNTLRTVFEQPQVIAEGVQRTLTNLSNQPDQPNQPTPAKIFEWFMKIWNAYPSHRRHGKDVAYKRFENTVATLEDARRCARALEHYTKSVSDSKYIMRGSKWFAEWEDHADERRDSTGAGGSMAQAGATPGIPENGIEPSVRKVLDGLGNSMPPASSKDGIRP